MIIPTQASKEAAERILRIAQDDPETARRDAAEIVQAASDQNGITKGGAEIEVLLRKLKDEEGHHVYYRGKVSEFMGANQELSAKLKAAKAGCCEVCWTTSWEPCEKDDPGAQQYKDGSGYVSCSHCQLVEALLHKYVKREVLQKCYEAMNEGPLFTISLIAAKHLAREELGRTKEPEFQVLES